MTVPSGPMGLGHVTLRFYGDLADLAADADRSGEVQVPVVVPRSVKDAIETCGVPHTEADLVLVNGTSVGFDALVGPGDRISVYPPFVSLDVEAVSRVRPDPAPTRFVLDVHLGRLAERLRLLGFDADYANDRDDVVLARISVEERRWLLTRDRGLLMRSIVTHGYLVRSDDPTEQTVEVVRRFGIADQLAPYSRCVSCGGELHDVAKHEVADELPARTRVEHDEFARCADCGRIFWPGSHRGGLDRFVQEVRRRTSATSGTGGVNPTTAPGPAAPPRSRRSADRRA